METTTREEDFEEVYGILRKLDSEHQTVTVEIHDAPWSQKKSESKTPTTTTYKWHSDTDRTRFAKTCEESGEDECRHQFDLGFPTEHCQHQAHTLTIFKPDLALALNEDPDSLIEVECLH